MRPSFRVGSTSYVYQGDLLHNLRNLAGQVDDVELILFHDEAGESSLPAPAEIAEMASILAASAMSVTVHLPRDVGGVLPVAELEASLALNRRVIELTAPLAPVAYVFHAHTTGHGTVRWRTGVLEAVEAMVALVENAKLLALENLESYAPEEVESIFAEASICRALDVGHLWKQRRDPLPVLQRWLPETSVVHLHGVQKRAEHMIDHCSLAALGEEEFASLDSVVHALMEWQGVLTLEVFEGDYFSSRRVLDETVARLDGVRRNAD